MPSFGQWILMMKTLAKVTVLSTTITIQGNYGGMVAIPDRQRLQKSFTDAGGTALDNYWYWSSSEYSKKHATVLQLDHLNNDEFAITADEKGQPCNVRAFIHF